MSEILQWAIVTVLVAACTVFLVRRIARPKANCCGKDACAGCQFVERNGECSGSPGKPQCGP